MPRYEYECRKHGLFHDWCPVADSHLSQPCPECGQPGTRQVSSPRLNRGGADSKAHAINEKSANEPRVVHRKRGDEIPVHDAHRDLTAAKHQAHHGHDHGHGHEHHSHGGEGEKKTVRSNHPWAVRH